MVTRLRYPKGYQFFDSNGAPLVLGNLYYYIAGTTTPQDTYSDSGGTIVNTNPIVLDGSGRLDVDVYLGSTADYKEVLTTASATVSPWPDDNILRATQADWNATSGPSEILNKPVLAAVATSGSYTDLSNTPSVFTGDSGSGGTSGLVPAPAAGTALANKFLKADGTWSAPPGGSGSSSTNLSVTETSNSVSIASSSGSGATIPAATSSAAGVLDSTRAAKIDGLATVASSGSYNDLSNKPTIPAPGGSSLQVQYNNAGLFGGMAGTSWNATTQRLSVTSLSGQDGTPVLGLTGTNVSSILDIVCADGTSDTKILRILSNVQGSSDLTNLAPIAYFGSDGELRTRAYLIISNTRSGTGDSFTISPPSTDSGMFFIWADTPPCMQTRVNLAGNSHWTALDHNGKYCFAVGETGNLGWANSASTYTMDTGLSRLAVGQLGLGNGAAGDYSGNLKLTTLTFADGSTQTTANAATNLTIASGKTFTVNKTLTLDGNDNKTLKINNSLSLAGTDGTTMTFPSASDTLAGLGTSQTFTADQTVNANLILGNNKNLKGTFSGGGTVNLLQLDTTNTLYIGSASLPNDVVFTPGSTKAVDFVNAAGTQYIAKFVDGGAKVCFGAANTDGKWTFYDATPTTGDSYMCIRDGAANGSRIAFGNSSGTYDVAFCHASAGAITINDSTTTFTSYRDLILRDLYTNNSSFMCRGKVSFISGTGSAAGTLTNAPVAGNPTKWIPIDDNGTTRYVPAW